MNPCPGYQVGGEGVVLDPSSPGGKNPARSVIIFFNWLQKAPQNHCCRRYLPQQINKNDDSKHEFSGTRCPGRSFELQGVLDSEVEGASLPSYKTNTHLSLPCLAKKHADGQRAMEGFCGCHFRRKQGTYVKSLNQNFPAGTQKRCVVGLVVDDALNSPSTTP